MKIDQTALKYQEVNPIMKHRRLTIMFLVTISIVSIAGAAAAQTEDALSKSRLIKNL
jgi:hypothetical protein